MRSLEMVASAVDETMQTMTKNKGVVFYLARWGQGRLL